MKRFKSLTSFDSSGESYYFSTPSLNPDNNSDDKDASFLKHDFDKFNFETLKDYSSERKSQNIMSFGNLGMVELNQLLNYKMEKHM